MKYCLTIISFLAGALSLNAQSKALSVFIAPGISDLNYTLGGGTKKSNFGLQFGGDFRYGFTETLGIAAGLEFSLYNSSSRLDNLYTHNDARDDTINFELRSRINGYTEKQQIVFLQIPIMLNYVGQTSVPFYVSIGAKLGIPVISRFENSMTDIETSGYYEHEDKEYTGPEFLFRGFGKFTDRNFQNKLKLTPAVFLAAETGVRLGNIYLGLYVDYGLISIAQTSPKSFVEYNDTSEPPSFTVNSILESTYSDQNGIQQPFVEKAIPLSFGFKLRFALERGGSGFVDHIDF